MSLSLFMRVINNLLIQSVRLWCFFVWLLCLCCSTVRVGGGWEGFESYISRKVAAYKQIEEEQHRSISNKMLLSRAH